EQSTNDTVIINAYLAIAIEYVYSFPDKTEEFALKAKQKAEKINYQQKVAESLRLLGTSKWAKFQPHESIQYFLEALRQYEKINDIQGVANCYGNLGLVYAQQKEYDEAMNYHMKSMEIQIKLNNIERIGVNYNNIADLYLYQKQYDLAEENYRKSLACFEKVGYKRGVILNKINLGEILLAKGLYRQALDSFRINYQLSEQTKDRRLIIRSMRGCAEAYLGLNNIAEAEKYVLKCAEMMEKTNLKQFTKDIYTLLSKVYRQKGDYQKAFEYWYLQDSIFNQEQDNRITSYRMAYETEKKQKEIDKLTYQQKIHENYILIATTVGILLIIIVIMLWYGLRHNKKLNHVLSLKNEEIQAQNKRIQETQKEILAQAEQLKESNQVKDKLFSIISHDLKSPIHNLKNILSLFEQGGLSNEEIQMLMRNIYKDVVVLEDTINNLLMWAKNQMNVINLQKE
ncbi:MAG: tetratricopeptide repeat protein, partial [Flammeovirgaceae bacterium]|nr:tetratricopeptide repeat protein [Flammeovirgaceae bacterium]MDW8288657.1 tetratricopeptide repeat protein [Flammeovirgaceae bacterium]